MVTRPRENRGCPMSRFSGYAGGDPGLHRRSFRENREFARSLTGSIRRILDHKNRETTEINLPCAYWKNPEARRLVQVMETLRK